MKSAQTDWMLWGLFLYDLRLLGTCDRRASKGEPDIESPDVKSPYGPGNRTAHTTHGHIRCDLLGIHFDKCPIQKKWKCSTIFVQEGEVVGGDKKV